MKKKKKSRCVTVKPTQTENDRPRTVYKQSKTVKEELLPLVFLHLT